jgi:uncharacterized protein YjbJ (UPF0337 family)
MTFNLITTRTNGCCPMNMLDVVSRWNIVKGELKQRYDILTDDDLTFRWGKEGALIYKLQQRLGKSRADIMRIIGELN